LIDLRWFEAYDPGHLRNTTALPGLKFFPFQAQCPDGVPAGPDFGGSVKKFSR